MPTWIDLAPVADLPAEGKDCRTLEHNGQTLGFIVFPQDGDHHVMANVCPHAGLPLGEGDRRGLTITCPFHGYTYRITDGKDLDDPEFGEPAHVYPSRVHEGTLQIDLGPDKPPSV